MPDQSQLARHKCVTNHRQLLIEDQVHLVELLVSFLSGASLSDDLQRHLILLFEDQLILSLDVLRLSLGKLLELFNSRRASVQLLLKPTFTLNHRVNPFKVVVGED